MSSNSKKKWSSQSSGLTYSLPELLVDQSLGTVAIPAVFREAGYVVKTVKDIFGHARVDDIRWMEYADSHAMGVVCKDERIRKRPLELQMLYNSNLRVLCLTQGNLRSEEQAAAFREHMDTFTRFWRRSGPLMLGVRLSGVEQLVINQPT